MAVSEKSAALTEPTYARLMGRGKRPAQRRAPEEYQAIWQELYDDALARTGEPNAARYAANQAFAEVEADDNGYAVGRGDYEPYL